jgi:hypothetical protein
MNALKLLGFSLLIVMGVLLLMVLHDLIHPYKPIDVVITPDMVVLPELQSAPITPQVAWEDDINNPDNQPYVLEVAFNEGCDVDEVTQRMFNARYLND